MKYLLHIAAAYVVVLALLLPFGKGAAPRPNIILISLDTLRADHLSAYGHHRPTPNLDRFAGEGVLFENAYSQAPWTTASHMSLFSSLYPSVHRVTHEALNGVDITLTQYLQKAGYQTAAFVQAAALDKSYGFSAGFDLYEMKAENPSAKVNNERARKWIGERDHNRPFFLFLHYYDIHRKYDPPPPYNRAYCETCMPELDALIVGPYGKMKRIPQVDLYNIKALYDGEIRFVDDCMGELFDYLKQQKIYKDALIVLVSDHGEGFLEHGLMDHGNSLYQELLHVPMIMKFPGDSYAGKRIVETARLLDVFPTMLDMLRIRSESLTQGVSLMPRVQGRSTTVNPAISTGGVGSEAIVMNGWKLIHNNELEKRLVAIPLAVNNEFELYNLNVDPGEWNNLTEVRIKEREQLWQRLLAERAVNEQLSKRIHTEHKPLDAQMEEQLRSLGYLQ